MEKDHEAPGDDPVSDLAVRVFGIKYLFPWQRLVIANILDAVDADRQARTRTSREPGGKPDDELFDEDGIHRGRQIVLLPTGAGKSLCFQLPALLLGGPTLVIYPLLALMGDQERRMREAGLDPVIFRGEQDAQVREACYARLEGRDGKPPARLIIANPEVLAGKRLMERLAARGIVHVAIDEAHCVSEWGDSFRPAYRALGEILETLAPSAVTAFTATASPAVLSRVAEVLFGGRAHLVRGDSDRPNIVYRVHRCRAKEPALLREVLRCKRPLVVFCATRGGTERSALILRELPGDPDVRFYHAGLAKEEKITVERWFHAHPRGILCTTCAWGMGVDKKDVRTVIHRDPPPTAEAYVQEAGRGGRDGVRADAVLLWSPEDGKRIERMGEPSRGRARVLVEFAENGRCRREVLLEALGDPRARPGAEEGIACSGCDVCDGTASPVATDEALVLDFLGRNPRCLSREQAAALLCEAGNRHSRTTTGAIVWKRSDFARMLQELEGEGLIRENARWPLKGTLELTGTSSVSGHAGGVFSCRVRALPPPHRPPPHRPPVLPAVPRFFRGRGRAVPCGALPGDDAPFSGTGQRN